MGTPWDIYVDERKCGEDSALGFLVVPNTASFMHKLFRCRHVTNALGQSEFRPYEIHWHSPRMDTLEIAEQWIFRVFQHKGVRFYRKPWGRGQPKELVILGFLERFCRLKKLEPPFNVVTFLDFDNSHSAANIQNRIQRVANIARCYHLDSRNNDCLQCCDLLLGATSLLWGDPSVRDRYVALRAQRISYTKLKDSEIKKYLAGFLACHIDGNPRCIYDLRHKAREAERIEE